MLKISLIASVSQDYGLGKDGHLLWQIPEDMRFFRQTTLGHPVIMGRKTYESIGHPLPQRQNIILSRGDVNGDVEVCHSRAEVEKFLQDYEGEVFIIGGASLYEMFLDAATHIYLTEVAATKPADAFFPRFNQELYDRKVLQSGEHAGVKYEIIKYTRKEGV